MKHALFALLILSGFGFAEENKKTVAIYMVGGNREYADVLTADFSEVFTGSKGYAVVERTNYFLELLRKEYDYQGTGNVDDSYLATLGKQSGAAYVSIIEVMEVGKGHFVTSRLISTEKAAIVATSDGNGRITDLTSLRKISKEVAKGLLKSAESKRDFSRSKRVAIFTGGSSEDDKLLGVKLVSAITSSNEYIAMERTSEFLRELGKEIEYQNSGNVDDRQLAALGKQFGVEFICASKISNVLGSNFLKASLLDVNTAIVERTANTDFTYKNDDERYTKIKALTDDLLLTKEEKSKWHLSTKVAISLDLLGLGLIAGGLWLNKEVNTYLDDYNATNSRESHDAATDSANKRNLAYGIGAALIAGGAVVHVMF